MKTGTQKTALVNLAAILTLALGLAQTGLADAVPHINQPLAPAVAAPGGAGFTLTVNGTGFVTGATVQWNGTALSTTFVSPSQLTAAVPAANIAAAGTAQVSVKNPAGEVSNSDDFPITVATDAVTLKKTDFAVGGSPISVASGDFNGDGILDLAVANQGLTSNTVSILLGKGDGTFAGHVDYTTGMNPQSVTVGDFNGDGKPDLAVANGSGNTVSILLGNGDGTFQPHMDFATGAAPGFIIAADLNGDGKLDLITADSLAAGISVLLGNGDGTFQGAVLHLTGTTPRSVAVGDFNGDGHLDLAVADAGDNAISVLLGDGSGGFAPAAGSPISAGNNPSSVVAADLDGDGKLDLAVANQGSNNISILKGKGDGAFTALASYTTGATPSSLAIADLNGDGKLDLITSNGAAGTVSVLLGNGDATFGAAASSAAGGSISGLAAGDFNRDGRLDLAAADASANSAAVLAQAPAVSLSPASLDFGKAFVGTLAPLQTVVLTNTGSAALNVSSVTGGGDYIFANTCNNPIAPGGQCHAAISFGPKTAGEQDINLVFTDDAADSPQKVPMKGSGADFSLSISPGSASISAGGSASYTLTVTPLGGLDSAVNFGCTNFPIASACVLGQSSVTPDGKNPVTVSVTMNTTRSTLTPPGGGTGGFCGKLAPPGPIPLLGLPALLLAVLLARRSRILVARRAALVPAAILLMAMLMSSCGGSGVHVVGTPPGTYTMTLNGYAGPVAHQTTFTLTVN